MVAFFLLSSERCRNDSIRIILLPLLSVTA
ncbi:Uncharacterised protein [Vibrio cholerae]|nr:Uncharacterised protein [Vibrio cholerae]